MQDYEDYYDYEDDYYEEGEKDPKGKKRFELILGTKEEDASESGNGYWADDSPSVKDRQRSKKIR